MSELSVAPFEIPDLDLLIQRAWAVSSSGEEWKEMTRDLWHDPGGLGYTARAGSRIVAIGLVIRSPMDPFHEGVASFHTAEGVERHGLSVTRNVARLLPQMVRALGLCTVWASVIEEWPEALRFVEVLRFSPAGLHENPLDPKRRVWLFRRDF